MEQKIKIWVISTRSPLGRAALKLFEKQHVFTHLYKTTATNWLNVAPEIKRVMAGSSTGVWSSNVGRLARPIDRIGSYKDYLDDPGKASYFEKLHISVEAYGIGLEGPAPSVVENIESLNEAVFLATGRMPTLSERLISAYLSGGLTAVEALSAEVEAL